MSRIFLLVQLAVNTVIITISATISNGANIVVLQQALADFDYKSYRDLLSGASVVLVTLSSSLCKTSMSFLPILFF